MSINVHTYMQSWEQSSENRILLPQWSTSTSHQDRHQQYNTHPTTKQDMVVPANAYTIKETMFLKKCLCVIRRRYVRWEAEGRRKEREEMK